VAGRRRIVRAPASSANLGPGFDVLGAALELELELEVAEEGAYSFDPGGLGVPTDRSNLLVRSFERLHPADGIAFRLNSEIPLGRGLGSSAAAIVAGLLAADHLFELGNSREALFAHACEIEGHPDNVAASLFGGIVSCPPRGAPARESAPDPIEILVGNSPAPAVSMPAQLAPPEGVEAILVIPEEEVPTVEARAALPTELSLADAVHNVAAAAQLVLGIERSDLTLIERGLSDRFHQPWRRDLYPRSMEVVDAARGLGAIGATISGAGPTVLVWCFWQSGSRVLSGLTEICNGWAEVRRVPFSPQGARVEI
jgi:homoserine kinase